MSKLVDRFKPQTWEELRAWAQRTLQEAEEAPEFVGAPSSKEEAYNWKPVRMRRADEIINVVNALQKMDVPTMWDTPTKMFLFLRKERLFRYSPGSRKIGLVGMPTMIHMHGIADALSRLDVIDLLRANHQARAEKKAKKAIATWEKQWSPQEGETWSQHLDRLLDVQQTKGYKPGWVDYKFKDAWGVWPREAMASSEPEKETTLAKVISITHARRSALKQ